MSRETLVRSTVTTNLGWDENQEKAIDRLTAIAYTHEILGSMLLRALAGEEDAYFHACEHVARKIRRKCINISASRVAAAVLTDLIDQRCQVCLGRGQMEIGKVVHICPECEGSKLRNTRKNQRKVGGKAIPDDIYRLAYGIYADALGRVTGKADNLLKNEYIA